MTDPNGIRRWFGFDERDRVVSQTVGSGEGGTAILRQGFDASGNLLWNQRRGQGVVRREYGEEGRILGLWEEGGEAVGFHYDQSGRFAGTSRLSSREELGTGAAPPATLRELSPDRSSPSPPAPSDGGPGNWNGHIRPLKFDLLSRILISEDSQGRTTHYEYNGFGELIAKQGPTGNFRFAYDENGNMVWEHQPDGTETRREFDALNRLARVTTSSSDGSSTEHRFAYDGCENGLGKLCEASGSSQTKRFQYDTLGNLASVHSMFVPLTKSPWAPADWQGTLSKESPNDRNGEGGGGYLDSGGATRSSTLMKIYYCEFNCQGTPIYTLVDEDLAWNAGFRSYLRSDSFDYGDMVCVNLVDPSPPPPPVIVFLPSRPASISITTSPSTLLIDRHLNMPSVTFEANVDPGSSAPNSFQAAYEWYKEIKFRRGARNYTNRFPARGMVSTGSTRRWTPDWGSFLRGGNDVTVHVKVTLTESGGADPSTITLSDTQTGFQIHGQNPTQSQIFAIATKAEYKAVAWQESTHRQFVGIRYTGVGLPLWGAPDGWGLMQLELNTPGRNWGENEIWKWDKNLREGAQYLEDIYSQALGYLIERHRLDSLRDPPIIWSTNPANEPDSVWDDTFARYNTGDSIYYPSGNGGVRNCAKRAAGCNYADRVRGHINRPPW